MNYKRYKKELKPCDKKKIFDQLKLKIATDASLNLEKMKKFYDKSFNRYFGTSF